jgi:hypothetical protein
MENETNSVAIILHGPPCAGKTVIGREICSRRAGLGAHFISLDEGWGPNQIRYAGGGNRYLDLEQSTESLLVIELGCGEPADLSFHGATRGAQEWIRVLLDSGRRLCPFLLWPDWSDAISRLNERHRGSPCALFAVWQHVGLYALYERQDPTATFPATPGFREQRVNTSNRSVSDLAEEIMALAGVKSNAA